MKQTMPSETHTYTSHTHTCTHARTHAHNTNPEFSALTTTVSNQKKTILLATGVTQNDNR